MENKEKTKKTYSKGMINWEVKSKYNCLLLLLDLRNDLKCFLEKKYNCDHNCKLIYANVKKKKILK